MDIKKIIQKRLNKILDKRGMLGLDNLALGVLIFVIVLVIGQITLAQFALIPNIGANATTTISAGQSGLATFNSFIPIIVIVGIAGVVIFLVRKGLQGGNA